MPMIIINDSTPEPAFQDMTRGRGLDLGLRGPDGYGTAAARFNDSLLIPRSEWQARIQERKDRQIRHIDIAKAADLPCKDQNGTNYCWINAPCYCDEYCKVWQNQPKVILSPASGGAPIKNFSNSGGWGREALVWMSEKGLNTIQDWPANAISRAYYTDANREKALLHRTPEWMELAPRNIDQLFSLILRGIPVAVGYNWWGHEVTGVDGEWLDNEIALIIRNSWGMGWGEDGYGILQGSRMIPDDSVAPLLTIAT